MTKHTEQARFWQELSRLEKDLEQAAKWQAPVIALALYDTALNGSKAVGLLEDRLNRNKQQVAHITPDARGQIAMEEAFAFNKAWNETVFFVMHVGFNTGQALYNSISERSDFIINNRIRIIYWLTEDDFTTYIAQMPENWIFEQRLYSLSERINWQSIWSHIGTRTWKERKEHKNTISISENTSFETLLSLDIRDDLPGLIKRANTLNKFALFYIDQEQYKLALLFAKKAYELAKYLGEETFITKTSLVSLLAEIKAGHKNSATQLQSTHITRKSATWILLGKIYTALYMQKDAQIAYQNAIDYDRYNTTAHKGLADILIQQQQTDQALNLYQQALEQQPNFSAAWVGLSRAYKAVGNLARALECYQSAVEINCFQPDLWLEISEISEQKTALLAIKRALELDSQKATFWNSMGNIQYQNQNYNDAIRSYYKATNIQKDFGWAYANMALVHEQTRQYEKAILLLTKSIQSFKNDFEKAYIQYRLGYSYQQLKRYTDAAQAYKQAQTLFPNNRLLEHYRTTPGPLQIHTSLPVSSQEKKHGFSQTKTRSLEPREKMALQKVLPQQHKISYSKTLKKALETNQQASNMAYWLDLGSYYIRQRMYDLAEDTYRIAIELEPGNGWAYFNLGRAYMYAGLYEKSIPLYEKSIDLFTRPRDKALCWNQLANVYRRLNEYSLAVAAHERARILEPPRNSVLARARASLLNNCYAH